MLRARIESGTVSVLEKPHPGALVLRALGPGDEISFADRPLRADGWTRIERPTQARGWIQRQTTRMDVRRPVVLLDPVVHVRASPDGEGAVLRTLTTRARFALLGPCDSGDDEWIRVELPSGKQGFVPGSTRVKDEDREKWEDVEGSKGGAHPLIEWFARRGVVGGLSLAALAVAVLLVERGAARLHFEAIGFLLLGLWLAMLGVRRGRGGRTDTAWHLAPPRDFGVRSG